MKVLQAVKEAIRDRRPIAMSGRQEELIQDLRRRVAGLANLDDGDSQSAAAAEWLGYRRRLRQLIADDDPRRFLQWDVIDKTMFVASFPFVRTELAELRKSKNWAQQWRPNLWEDPEGCPQRCRYRLSSSGNRIHHMYQLLRAEAMLGRKISELSCIIEFGGGYGSFGRLVWRLGFGGRYVIFDLPEFSALQRYYLSSVGVPLADHPGETGVRCICDVDELVVESAASRSLFVGLWSISETPSDLRRQILDVVGGLDSFFIAYQDRFNEVDNVRFFTEWAASKPHLNWQETPMGHLPGNRYLVGSVRSRP